MKLHACVDEYFVCHGMLHTCVDEQFVCHRDVIHVF